jgi:uncharacterized protein (TIGR00725 family)
MIKVAIYGSAKTEKEALAFELGMNLSRCNISLITGAATGISEAVAIGFNCKDSIGYSPTRNQEEIIEFKTISFNSLANVLHTGIIFDQFKNIVKDSKEARFKFRNYLTAAACDVAICIDGGFGTFTEVVLALGMDKNVVVLRNSGGVSDKLISVLELIDMKKEKLIVVDSIKEVVSYIEKFVRTMPPNV